MAWLKRDFGNQWVTQCQELNNSAVIQAFSSRSNGNMGLHTGDCPEDVIKRRKVFLNGLELGLDSLTAGGQTHGIRIKVVSRDDAGAGAWSQTNVIPDTDVLITRERGITLAVFTADCLPVFIYDPVTPAIAVIHAGWRGTIHQIVRLTVEKLASCFNSDPAFYWAALGPAIGGCCFQVDHDLAERFKKVDPDVIIENESGFYVDLIKFNFKALEETGLKPTRILKAGICTSCQRENFFSYRAETGSTGRMMGIIALK